MKKMFKKPAGQGGVGKAPTQKVAKGGKASAKGGTVMNTKQPGGIRGSRAR